MKELTEEAIKAANVLAMFLETDEQIVIDVNGYQVVKTIAVSEIKDFKIK